MAHSIPLSKSTAVWHPEGWFPFKVEDLELSEKSKFGPQIKFTVRSAERNADTGEPIRLTYFTGTALSAHPDCKITSLFLATGIIDKREDVDDWEDGEGDACLLLGKVFEGLVSKAEKGDFFNIVQVRALGSGAKPPARKAAPARQAPARRTLPSEEAPAEFSDPFADE
jgi:hypothetical protein